MRCVRSPAFAACTSNPVACENQLPGDPPSDWQVSGAGDSSIQGFATPDQRQRRPDRVTSRSRRRRPATTSTSCGSATTAATARARSPSNIKPTATLPQTQPACQTDSSTGLIDCGNWSVSASWTVPSTAVSGVYIAHLVRDDAQDPGGDSQIPFVVRNDSSHSDILLATSDATWEAYNDYGGNSLYTLHGGLPARQPAGLQGGVRGLLQPAVRRRASRPTAARRIFYYAEYQMIQFLEENGYDVSYIERLRPRQQPARCCSTTSCSSPAATTSTGPASESPNVKAALARGRQPGVLQRQRDLLEDALGDELGRLQHALPHADHLQGDPLQRARSIPRIRRPGPAPGPIRASVRPPTAGVPANALTGQEFIVNSGHGRHHRPVPVQQAAALAQHRGRQASRPGQSLTLGPGTGTLGYEWDVDADNGFRPAGRVRPLLDDRQRRAAVHRLRQHDVGTGDA